MVRIRNGNVSWTRTGIVFESDPRHAKIVCTQLDLADNVLGETGRKRQVKSVATPGVKEHPAGPGTPLTASQTSSCCSLVMGINYLAQDRSDLQFSGEELAMSMSSPTTHDWQKLKRVGRYLVGVPRLELFYRFQKFVDVLNCYVDSDCAIVAQ